MEMSAGKNKYRILKLLKQRLIHLVERLTLITFIVSWSNVCRQRKKKHLSEYCFVAFVLMLEYFGTLFDHLKLKRKTGAITI